MLKQLYDKLEKYQLFDSHCHGFDHWVRVYYNGMTLARHLRLDHDAMRCIEVFAWTHDLLRETDDDDDGLHAYDAADKLQVICDDVFPDLKKDQIRITELAVRYHSDGMTAYEAYTSGLLRGTTYSREDVINIVGCCWDADRLDLPRVGIKPHPRYMTTDVWNKS